MKRSLKKRAVASVLVGFVMITASITAMNAFGAENRSQKVSPPLKAVPTVSPGARAASAPPNPYDLINSFVCRVIINKDGQSQTIEVKPTSDPSLKTISVAERRGGTLNLTISINPYWMNKFAPQTRLFWREHECAHHTLAHTLVTTPVDERQLAQDEDDADCTAIQTMVKGLPGQAPMINKEGRERIKKDLRYWLLADGYYKSGTARAAHIEACAHAVGG